MKISKAEIYKSVEQYALYIAAKTRDITALQIDRATVIDQDHTWLDSLLHDAARELTDTLRWAVAGECHTARSYQLDLTPPPGVSAATIEGIMRHYFRNSILAGWLRTVGDPASAYYADLAAGNLQSLRNLYLRPTQRQRIT